MAFKVQKSQNFGFERSKSVIILVLKCPSFGFLGSKSSNFWVRQKFMKILVFKVQKSQNFGFERSKFVKVFVFKGQNRQIFGLGKNLPKYWF